MTEQDDVLLTRTDRPDGVPGLVVQDIEAARRHFTPEIGDRRFLMARKTLGRDEIVEEADIRLLCCRIGLSIGVKR
jgi:hypothetical protein